MVDETRPDHDTNGRPAEATDWYIAQPGLTEEGARQWVAKHGGMLMRLSPAHDRCWHPATESPAGPAPSCASAGGAGGPASILAEALDSLTADLDRLEASARTFAQLAQAAAEEVEGRPLAAELDARYGADRVKGGGTDG